MLEHCNADFHHYRSHELPLVGGGCQPLPLPVGAGRRIWWIRSRGQRRRARDGVLSVVLILIPTHYYCLLQNITSEECYCISISWTEPDLYCCIVAIQVVKSLSVTHKGHLWECQYTEIKCCILKQILDSVSPCIVGGALGFIVISIKLWMK